MKIQIESPVSDLKQALIGLGKVMSRAGLPALRCVRIVRSESRQVTLSVTDLDSVATYRVKEPIPGDPVTMLVPWELFSKVIKATKDRAIFMREKADQVAVRYFVGSMSFEEPAAMPPLDEWPKLPVADGVFIELKPEFKPAFADALNCASTDGARPVLRGVCLDVSRPEGHYVVATDARQLYSANSFHFDLPHSIIVPDRRFLHWAGFQENGDWKLRVNWEEKPDEGGWLEIEANEWTFGTRLITGPYPNWRQIFPSETTTLATVRLAPSSMEALLQAVPLVQTQQPHNTEFVCLDARESGLFLMARSAPNAPWTELSVPDAQVSGVRTISLMKKEQFLHALRMGFNEIELRDAFTPVVLRAPGKQMALGVVNGQKPNSEPSAAQPIPSTTVNERNSMNTTTSDRNKTITPTPAPAEDTPIRAAMAQVETVRNSFRDGLNGLNQAMALLKAAERDQKSSDKEIESVRSTLRTLQRVQI